MTKLTTPKKSITDNSFKIKCALAFAINKAIGNNTDASNTASVNAAYAAYNAYINTYSKSVNN
jgi:hypothetical protein